MTLRNAMFRCLLAASLMLGSHALPAQTNSAPQASNPCLQPTPRTDEQGKKRTAELDQRVKGKQGQVDLLFLGDSITQGWELSGKKAWEKYYAHRRPLNLGVGSDGTQHVLWRLEHGQIDGIAPKVVVLLIGVNNAAQSHLPVHYTLEGVTAVVQKLRAKLPQAKILLLGIFPYREQFNDQRGRALQVNQALQKLDDGQWVHFLDFGHRFIQPDGRIAKETMRDFLHLSPPSYQIWAECMEPKLAQLLGDQPVQP